VSWPVGPHSRPSASTAEPETFRARDNQSPHVFVNLIWRFRKRGQAMAATGARRCPGSSPRHHWPRSMGGSSLQPGVSRGVWVSRDSRELVLSGRFFCDPLPWDVPRPRCGDHLLCRLCICTGSSVCVTPGAPGPFTPSWPGVLVAGILLGAGLSQSASATSASDRSVFCLYL
jgi:hypothetical protein